MAGCWFTVSVAFVVHAGCKEQTQATTGRVEIIPRSSTTIKIDGEWDEPDWSKRALRGQFLGDDGQLARPSSEVRLLHDATYLYVGLYAADDNIQATDAFELEIGTHHWTVSALGKVTPAIDGAVIGVDRDGTVDDPSNNDEEWVIELANPRPVELERGTQVRASRCDTPKGQPERCGAWAGTLAFE